MGMRRDASVWVLGLAAVLLLTSCEKPKPSLYDTSLPVLEVMVHQIDPGLGPSGARPER